MIATLIINPAAGRATILNSRLPAIQACLADRGYSSRILTTSAAPHSARDLTLSALDSTIIFACGGDGTVHGVIQALASSGVPMGVLPSGTANALARNLRLPLDPLEALKVLLAGTTRTIPLGQITTSTELRSFSVLAGCGPDGALVHTLSPASKARYGRAAYYARAAHLFVTQRWPVFQVDYRLPGSTDWQTTEATALLASRVPDLGGLFAGLTPHANLDSPSLHVQLLRSPAHLAFPAWFALRHRAVSPLNPWLTTLDVAELRCTPLSSTPIYVEADAEPLGSIPIAMTTNPNALTLWTPTISGSR